MRDGGPGPSHLDLAAPAPFYKDFTATNLARLADLKREHAETTNPPSSSASDNNATKKEDDDDDTLSQRLTGLPSNLRNLQPPLPPDEGAWRVFGDPYRLVQPLPKLEEGGEIRPVVSGGGLASAADGSGGEDKHFDRATVLKRIAKSLLLNFLELVGILSQNAMDASEKVKDIRDLFYNFHHLINEYRPHQARESLIAMMQAQLDRTRAETTAIRDSKEKVERLLEGLGSLKIDHPPPPRAGDYHYAYRRCYCCCCCFANQWPRHGRARGGDVGNARRTCRLEAAGLGGRAQLQWALWWEPSVQLPRRFRVL
ncbi:MED7 protein-domain-containing protein [Apiospora arundinis]